jgi:oligoribonuclease
LTDEHADRTCQQRAQLGEPLALRGGAGDVRVTRGGQRGDFRRRQFVSAQVGLVDRHRAGDPGRGGRAQVSIDDEEIRLRNRSDDHHELRDVCHHRLAFSAQVGARQQRGSWQHLDDHHLVMRAICCAAHSIAAHDAQAASGGAGTQLLRPRAYQHMTAVRRDYLGVELVCGGIGRHSCSIASFHMPSSDYLVWIDLEMTGLKPDTDVIIEMATIVTDIDLNVVAEGPVIAIHQPPQIMDSMDEWNKRTHGASGLIERVRTSGYTMASAEKRTLESLTLLVEPGSSPMCGNSICQDRRFLARHMPALERFFHYRNLDVSTLKELARRWAPELIPGFSKRGEHMALADIQESIRELAYYREHLLAPEYAKL